MERSQHIEAEVTLLPTEHGGRSGPVESGYSSQSYYDGVDWDAEQIYLGVGSVRPGETVRARISFFNPQVHRGRVFEGMPFLIREGNRVAGYGRVTRLLALPSASGEVSATVDNRPL